MRSINSKPYLNATIKRAERIVVAIRDLHKEIIDGPIFTSTNSKWIPLIDPSVASPNAIISDSRQKKGTIGKAIQ